MIAGKIIGQLVFRRCGGNTDVAVGFIQVDADDNMTADNKDAHVSIVAEYNLGDTLRLHMLEEKQVEQDHEGSDLANLLTSHEYHRAQRPARGGAIFLRQSRMPAPPGKKTLLVALIVEAGDDQFNAHSIYEVMGADGVMVAQRARPLSIEPNGMALSQIHRSPIWGWNEDPWGPVSTMRLDFIDECQELVDIQERNDPADAVRRDQLERSGAGQIMSTRQSDKQFKQYLCEIQKAGLATRWDAAITESQQAERDRVSDEIVRRIIAA